MVVKCNVLDKRLAWFASIIRQEVNFHLGIKVYQLDERMDGATVFDVAYEKYFEGLGLVVVAKGLI